ncbi:MAG: hypothetical protein HKN68_07630, partial [Saprospiraceae bacterium]|nr:hypothetical protein [Saprospiraceae bacterium]
DGVRPNATCTVQSVDMDCNDAGEAVPSDPIGDCDDSNANVYPGAPEIIGNGIDENCDTQEVCYVDADNDGYRTNSTTFSVDMDCNDSGEATPSDPIGDCDDLNASVYPGTTEIVGNGIDDDCDGFELCYCDQDDDGVRPNATCTVQSADLDCNDSGEATPSDPIGDCDDSNAGVYPGASEIVGNGIDDDCDGFELCYCDQDDDGVRPDATCTVQSVDMDCNDSGEATPSDPIGDCDDSNANVYPGAPEIIGNDIDENCDTQELCYVDADDDGYRTNSTVASVDLDCMDSGEATPTDPAGDCNDGNAGINPGVTEICNDGIDNDCDGNSYGPDSDGDGICDEVDNCSSQYNPIQSDTDNDGVGDSCDPDFIDVENIGLGTNTPKTKFHLKNGKLFLDKISGSLMMKSPNGSCWLLTIDNSGNISSMKVDCPG